METFHHILKGGCRFLSFCYIFTGGIFKTFLEGVLNFLQRITKNAIGAVTGVR
jgi:hypothetical protein